MFTGSLLLLSDARHMSILLQFQKSGICMHRRSRRVSAPLHTHKHFACFYGVYEALEFRDGGSYYLGKGVAKADVFGSIAYVSQTSWIQSGMIRDNILFGKLMNKTSYEKAVRCCALDKDIESFDHGDLTEIGQRGLNMSGGQKQRIQLARVVYNDADTYILDDPFSAVDEHSANPLP